ncbi:MAG: nicotinamide riboside transporter PnuC [Bacteroidota bacterium]
MNELFHLFGQPISAIELAAVVTGLWGVWLTAQGRSLCFPVGLVNVAVYAFIFFHPSVRLYADGSLQVFFGILLLYGWYEWAKRKVTGPFSASRLSLRSTLTLAIFVLVTALVLGETLTRFTDAALPRLDALLTTLSLAAQWMVAKKKIENWLLWIVVDVIYIPVYWFKHLPLTALLYVVFLGLAVQGFYQWKKSMTEAPSSPRAH